MVTADEKHDESDGHADLAKAFLFDKDAKGPREKIAAYYNCIVDTN